MNDIPQPTFLHRAYGVNVCSFGEGGFAAQGHVGKRRFIAAANHLARTGLGLWNMCEIRSPSAARVLGEVDHLWGIPVHPLTFGDHFEWAVEWCDQNTPGAIPMTVWQP